MKKILIALFILLIVCAGVIYIFIPSEINASALIKIKAPVNGAFRYLTNDKKWSNWITGSNFNSKKITASDPFLHKINIALYYNNDSVNTEMSLLNLINDSMAIQWKFMINSGLNPLDKIAKYNEAVKLKKDMDTILERMKLFLSKDENIYGITIKEATTKDSLLIVTETKLTHNPETNDIYKLVNELKNYAVNAGAEQTNFPMYNITKENGDTVRLMVALPVNKVLKETGSVNNIAMVKGRFLTCEVTGGNAAVENALFQMQYYFTEHNRTPMAITFNYLVTDRQQQPDTLKWITRIYAPVF